MEPTKFRLSIDGVQAVTGGLKQVEGSFRQVSDKVGDVTNSIGGLMAIGGTLSVGAFAGLIKSAIDSVDRLNDLSDTTGISVEKLSGLGYAAKLSGTDLDGLAKTINKLSVNIGKDAEKFAKLGVTAKEPIEAFKQFADVFASIEDTQLRAALGAEALGKSWESAAPALVQGGAKLGELIDKGQRLSGITREAAEQAGRFNDQIDELKATADGLAMGLASEMLPALNDITGAVKTAYEESGKLQALWVAMGAVGAFLFTDEFSSAKVKIQNLRNEIANLEDQKKQLSGGGYLQLWLFGSPGEIDTKIAGLNAQIVGLQASMQKPPKPQEKTGDQQEVARLEAKIKALLDGGKASEAANKELREQEALLAKLLGVNADYNEQLTRLQVMRDKRNMSDAQYIDLVKELIGEQPVAKKQMDEQAKAIEKAAEAYEKLVDTLSGGLAKLQDETAAQGEYFERLGLTKIAIAELDAAKLESIATSKEMQAVMQMESDLTGVTTLLLRKQAEELRKQAALKRAGAVKEAYIEQAEEGVQQAQRMNEQIGQSLSDEIMRGGKGGFDLLEDYAKTLILQPTIRALINPVVGAVTGTLGLPGAAGTAGTTGGSGLDSAVGSMAGSMFGAGGLTGAAMAGAGWVTGATTLSGSLAAGASLIGTGTAAGAASGLGMIAGALGPIALGVAAVLAIVNSLDDSGTYHTGGASRASAGGVSNIDPRALGFMETVLSAETEKMVGGLASSVVKILDSTATTFGKTAGYSAATAFADDTSEDGAWGALLIEKMGTALVDWDSDRQSRWAPREFGDGDVGRSQYLAALSGSVRTALDDIGLPDWAQNMLDALGDAPAIADLATVVDNINATQRALVVMGDTLAGFASLSDGAVSALIAAAGGVDALGAAASTYYDNFYQEGEKTANTTRQITEALTAVGVAMPATRAEFRSQVEAQIALGEAGAPAVAALLKVSGAFASVVAAAETATTATSAMASAMIDQKGLQDRAMGVVNTAYSALQRAVGAQRDVVTVAFNESMESMHGSLDTITGKVGKLSSLAGLLGSTINSMRMPSQFGADRAAASAQIAAALAIARASGVLPDADALAPALQLVSQPAEQLYATFQDYQRDFLLQKNTIGELSLLTDNQLTIEQRTLASLEDQIKVAERGYADEMARLDGILESAQLQIDALNGIDTSILALAEAIGNFNKASVAAGGSVIGGPTGGAVANTVFDEYGNSAFSANLPTNQDLVRNWYAAVGETADADGVAYWTKELARTDVSQRDVKATFGAIVEQLTGKSIPAFVAGGDHLGGFAIAGENGKELINTGPARIFNAAQTAEIFRGGNNAELIAEVRQLRAELSQLRKSADSTEQHTKRTRDVMEAVVSGNAAFSTEAA